MDENKETRTEAENELETEVAAEAEAEAVTEDAAQKPTEEDAKADDLSVFLDETNTEPELELSEVAKEVPKKKSSVGLIICIVAVILAVLVAVGMMFMNKLDGEKTGRSNMGNLGIATVVGDDVYYASTIGSGLYKANLNDGSTQQLSSESILFIQEVDGTIYYVDVVTGELCRFVDGVNDEVICAELCYAPQFAGDYIYYLRPSDYYVYRVTLNGGEPERVLDVPCNTFYVDGKKLYFEDINGTRFCVTELQTAIDAAKTELPAADDAANEEDQLTAIPGRTPEEIGATVLFAGFPDTVNVVGDEIYYSDSANGYTICRYKDGEVTQLGSGITARYVNVYNGNIYYTNMNDYALYRMNLDGSDVRKLSGEGEMAINNCIVDGKVIYAYMGATGEMGIAVADTNGTLLAALPETIENLYTDDENSEEFDESLDMSGEEAPAPTDGDVPMTDDEGAAQQQEEVPAA